MKVSIPSKYIFHSVITKFGYFSPNFPHVGKEDRISLLYSSCENTNTKTNHNLDQYTHRKPVKVSITAKYIFHSVITKFGYFSPNQKIIFVLKL
jgi:hypothetical protein